MMKARTIALSALVLLLLGLPSSASEPAPDWSSWLNGAPGMLEAIERYQEEPRPILVYFYTDWCGYCRQFERELLSDERVGAYVDDIIAVRINPEQGREESAISQRYRVSGYPGIFMHSATSKSLSRIDRMTVVEGRPMLLDPDAFIEVLRGAGSR